MRVEKIEMIRIGWGEEKTMGNIREKVKKNDYIYHLYTKIFRILGCNKIKGKKGNTIRVSASKIRRTKINVSGNNSYIEVGQHTLLNNCSITIIGNCCKVKIAENSILNGVNIWCEDDNSTVIVGRNGLMMGNVQLASTEGKCITIGDDFLFSDTICIRTGDSHSIVDLKGLRINQAIDVTLGNHVWVGNQVIILKGTEIADNCVVGSGSVVTKKFTNNLVIAGNPARVVKENIDWKFERI